MIINSTTTDVYNSKVSALCAALFLHPHATGYPKYPHTNHLTLTSPKLRRNSFLLRSALYPIYILSLFLICQETKNVDKISAL